MVGRRICLEYLGRTEPVGPCTFLSFPIVFHERVRYETADEELYHPVYVYGPYEVSTKHQLFRALQLSWSGSTRLDHIGLYTSWSTIF